MRKASSAKTTFDHSSNLIILLRRANSWTIHKFGRVNVRQKRRRPYFAQAQSFLSKDNLQPLFHPYYFASSRNSWTIHEFGRVLNAKKRQVQDLSFFGAEDEIRTRATVSHTTPLAGEPLEPLGYFCMAQYFLTFIQKLYYYITFFRPCQSFLHSKQKNICEISPNA